MTEEQKFLREVSQAISTQGRLHNIAWDHCARLLKMLVEERAMRKKAEWRQDHGKQPNSCLAGEGFDLDTCPEDRHAWSDSDWLAAEWVALGVKLWS